MTYSVYTAKPKWNDKKKKAFIKKKYGVDYGKLTPYQKKVYGRAFTYD